MAKKTPLRRIMRQFNLDEISAVDRPAQEGALIALTKRKQEDIMTKLAAFKAKKPPLDEEAGLVAEGEGEVDPAANEEVDPEEKPGKKPAGKKPPFKTKKRIRSAKLQALADALEKLADDDEDETELADEIVKRYIDPAEGAKTFTEVLACYKEEADYRDMMEKAWPLLSAINTSLNSIVADKKLDVAAKGNAMRASVEGFLAGIRDVMPEVEEVLTKALSATEEELDAMKRVAAGAGADTSEKNDDVTKQLEALTKQAADDKAAREKAEAELVTLKAVAALSADEKEYYDKADDKGKVAFLALEKKARFAAIKKALDDDETIEVGGVSISKRDDAKTFAIVSVMKANADALEKQVKEEREARQTAELEKAAATEFEGLPGSDEEKVAMLKGIKAMPDAAQKSVLAALANAQKIGKLALTNMGANARGGVHRVVKGADASGFEKRITEIRQLDKCGRTEAMRKARKAHPEEYAAWQGSQ